MTRKEAMAKELDLKGQLRQAINLDDDESENKIRNQLAEVRAIIGPVTVEEAYGQMAY